MMKLSSLSIADLRAILDLDLDDFPVHLQMKFALIQEAVKMEIFQQILDIDIETKTK